MSPISPVNQVKKSFDFDAQQQRQHQPNDDNSEDTLHFLLEFSVCYRVCANTFYPAGQMAANVIDFPCVLSYATRPIVIRFID